MRSSVLLAAAVAAFGCARDRSPVAPQAHTAPPVPVDVASAGRPTAGERHPEAGTEPDENVIAAMGMRVLFIDPGAGEPAPVDAAIVQLHTIGSGKVAGTIALREVNGGLDVVANVTGLPGAHHALHVHVFGDCGGKAGSAAGPHFNFTGSSFRPDGREVVGALGTLDAAAGVSTTHLRSEGASLQGKFSVLGRSIIVHARADDPERPPDGGVGEHLACGVIGLVPQPTSEDQLVRR
jgi:Cu-Zn family superoxide dismutase